MDLDGLGIPGPGSFGPLGSKALPALIALDEALLLLGLPSAATSADVRSAQRAALGALQAQLQAGTLDRSSFRTLVERLDVAVRSALVGMRAPVTSGTATGTPGPAATTPSGPTNVALPPGPVAPGSTSAAGASPATPSSTPTPIPIPTPTPTPTPAPTQPSAPAVPSPGTGSGAAVPSGSAALTASGEPADPTWVAPVRNGSTPASSPNPAPTGSAPTSPSAGSPVGPGNPADVLRPATPDTPARTPRADAAATMTALTSLPLLNPTPPTRAQHELWTAVLVPTAGTHVETATALASTTVARTDPQVAAATMHVALTLALDDLPPEERRALLPLAAGVYAQLEAVLPRAILSGLPPRDLLGALPLHLWAPGPDVRLTALVIALAVVAFMVWAGLR